MHNFGKAFTCRSDFYVYTNKPEGFCFNNGVINMTERIGDGLVRIGAMTEGQRDTVLKMQDNGDERMFGEIAIDLEFIDDQAILDYLGSKGL